MSLYPESFFHMHVYAAALKAMNLQFLAESLHFASKRSLQNSGLTTSYVTEAFIPLNGL